MAKKTRKLIRRPWTKPDEKALRTHSRNHTTVASVSRVMKRTQGALRQKAFSMGLPLGHRKMAR